MNISVEDLNINNQSGSVIATVNGWKVIQHYYKGVKRFYVRIPKNSELADYFGRQVMLRSHFVVMVRDGVTSIDHGCIVHHIDHDRFNDSPENLKVMTAADHDRYHREEDKTFSKAGGAFEGRKHTESTKKLMMDNAIKRGNNNVWDSPKSSHFEETKRKMSEKASGSENSQYRGDLDEEAIKSFFMECGNINMTAAHFGCSATAVRNRVKGVTPNRFVRTPRSKDSKGLVMMASLEGLEKAAAAFNLTVNIARKQIKDWWGHYEN